MCVQRKGSKPREDTLDSKQKKVNQKEAWLNHRRKDLHAHLDGICPSFRSESTAHMMFSD